MTEDLLYIPPSLRRVGEPTPLVPGAMRGRVPVHKLTMPKPKAARKLPQALQAELARLGYTRGQIAGLDRGRADDIVEFQVRSTNYEVER
jgi:hypothetical protein